MDYNLLPNLQFCKEIVDSYTSFLLYTHIPPAIIAVLLAVFVFIKNRDWSGRFLVGISLVYAVWTIDDLFLWIFYDRASTIMFLWSLIPLLSSLLAILTFYFTYTFVREKLPPSWVALVWALLLVPVIIFLPSTYNLQGFDIRNCVALEGNWYLYYYHCLGVITAVCIPFFLLRNQRNRATSHLPNVARILAVIGAEFFIIAFFVTSFLASYLVDNGILPDFGLEQYGILAMAIFMGFLGYIIMEYRAFNIQVLGAQALIVALLALIASQFAFTKNHTSLILISLTLVIALFFGFMLVRSVKSEIAQRRRVEALAKDLEKVNSQQVVLIRFITHQIKGFLTKSRNIFAMMKEGDVGIMPEESKAWIDEGFNSDTKGVATVQEILNASNIKSGKVSYTMAPFDIKALVEEIVNDLKTAADKKSIALNLHLPAEPLTYTGDRAQLINALKNLIDNSIKYTPSGSIDITLRQEAGKIIFETKDTGVGITPEDMQNLFTEGGHGKDSQKVNVESTGFGLYIVKNIIEGHKGSVRAESKGAGKGSHFIVELPAAA